VITGPTDEAAQRKHEEYLSYASPTGMMALCGDWTGLDFASLDPDTPLQAVENDSLRQHPRHSLFVAADACGTSVSSCLHWKLCGSPLRGRRSNICCSAVASPWRSGIGALAASRPSAGFCIH